MASFWFLSSLIMASMALPSLSSPPTTISAAPALLPNPPLSPPFTKLSPDISPLLPSPGGKLPSPTGSSIPTIPSNQSPPNPDEMAGFGPDFEVSPSGSKLISASSSLSLFGFWNLAVLVGLVSIWW